MHHARQTSKRAFAFTLIELLVVIAIIAILAAILFPVFAQAKQAAKKTAAISDMKQGVLAVLMYQGDYDDGFPLSDSGCLVGQVGCEGWGFGPPDAVPFEVMYPYTKNMDITIDPMSDLQGVANREQTQFTYIGSPYPPSIAQGTPAQLEYAAAVRSNIGYNFAFFSPWIYKNVGGQEYVGSASVSASQVTQPAHTLMFGTSIWNRSGGTPTGGGNWVVQTPCWEDSSGNLLQPMANYTNYFGAGQIFSYGSGWDPNPLSWNVYGGLWPFYNLTSSTAATAAQNGSVVIGWADGHAKPMPISQVAAGCSAYGVTAQTGLVTDPSKFVWATNQ
jgi:prepilin-type N-terminal cleavage/methylation domain-containing protein